MVIVSWKPSDRIVNTLVFERGERLTVTKHEVKLTDKFWVELGKVLWLDSKIVCDL